jgi:hypothetical protein
MMMPKVMTPKIVRLYDRMDDVREDIAFLRALVEDRDATMAHDGAILTAVGIIFGCVNLFYWSTAAGVLTVPAAWIPWAWVVGVLVLVPVLLLFQRQYPKPSGAASRAMRAAWQGVGTGITVAGVAFGLGAWRLQLPSIVLWAFPLALFTLYGAAWSVAFAVRRRLTFGFIAGGCYAAAILCGFFMGQAEEWLVLALGLFTLVAAPGIALVHQARNAS